MVTPDAKRKAVAHACTVHAVSQRRACLALTIDRSTVRYTITRPDDALLREAMKAVAAGRRRFGYRRIHIMLDRQGIVMNQKKLRRLYREEKLQVRRRGGRKRALGTRRPMLVPDRANARWRGLSEILCCGAIVTPMEGAYGHQEGHTGSIACGA